MRYDETHMAVNACATWKEIADEITSSPDIEICLETMVMDKKIDNYERESLQDGIEYAIEFEKDGEYYTGHITR